MRTTGAVLLLLACIGVAHAVTYTSLEEAVQQTPELSMLTERIDAFPSFANQVMATGFVGTLFAPMDSALKPIEKFATMMLSNPSTATDMLGLFVVPGAPLALSDLKDGMKLTTLNNQQVTVSIKNTADGQPIYYINQARIASGNIYAGQSIIHQMAGVIVAPSKQLLLNAALKTSGWSDNNPPATVNLSPNGPEQEVVEEPAAEEPAAEEPAPTTGEETQAPSDSDITYDEQPTDITYEEQPQTGDEDLGYEYGGDAEAEPAQEEPVSTVPATDDEATPAPPAMPATPTPTPATPIGGTTSAPAQQQQPNVPVTVVPAPSTSQQQPDPSITVEAGTTNTTAGAPATTTTSVTSKPPAATTTTLAAATPAPVGTKPTTTTTPAATPATTTSTGLPEAKTTSASSSVVVSAVAAVVPAVLALLMLA